MKKFAFFIFILFVFNGLYAQISETFSFDYLVVPDTGFWYGQDTSVYQNTFGDPTISFFNNYNSDYDSWDNAAFSTLVDTVTQDYSNQWSVYTGIAHSDSVFGLFYVPIDFMDASFPTIPVDIVFNQPVVMDSMFITNSTLTALTIKNGDMFSRKFSTDSSDYFKVIIYSINQTDTIDTMEVFLADYRTMDSVVVSDWIKVEFDSVFVTQLSFDLFTTDNGAYGANTPLYFCIDDISYLMPEVNIQNLQIANIYAYPNPTNDYINFGSDADNISFYTIDGKFIKSIDNYIQNQPIDVTEFEQGSYIVKAISNNEIKTGKFVKQ